MATSKSSVAQFGSADAIHRWPTPRSEAWVRSLLEDASSNGSIVAIVAVGSSVRPEVPSADLDLVMICRAPVTLKPKPPLEIDLRMYEAANVDSEIARGNDLLGWAVKFGRVLFERDGYWSAILESWRDKLPLPAADDAVHRAKEAHRRLTSVLNIGDIDAARDLALSYATHLARYELLTRKVYPASRPELPTQLRAVGCPGLARSLEELMSPGATDKKKITELAQGAHHTGGDTEGSRGNRKRQAGGRRS